MEKNGTWTLGNYFFACFLTLLTLGKSIGLGNDNLFYRIIFFTSLSFLVAKLMTDRWTKREIIFLTFVFCTIFINYILVRKETLLLSFLIFIGLKGMDLKQSLGIVLTSRIVGFFGILLSSLIGLVPNPPFYFWRAGSQIVRYGWGFGHPNLFHGSFLLIIVLLIFLYFDKLNFLIIISMATMNFCIYQVSFSRTSFLLLNLVLLVTWACKRSVVIKRMLFFTTPHLQFFLLIVTLLTSYFFGKYEVINKLDELLSGRLTYSNFQLKSGVSLFGKILDSSIIYDNSYSMMLSLYGLFISVLFFSGYYLTARRYANQENIRGCILLLAMSLFFFTESSMPSAMMNYSIFFMANEFYKRGSTIETNLNYTNL